MSLHAPRPICLDSWDPRPQVPCLRSGLSSPADLHLPKGLAGSGGPLPMPICRRLEAQWSAEHLDQSGRVGRLRAISLGHWQVTSSLPSQGHRAGGVAGLAGDLRVSCVPESPNRNGQCGPKSWESVAVPRRRNVFRLMARRELSHSAIPAHSSPWLLSLSKDPSSWGWGCALQCPQLGLEGWVGLSGIC